MHLRLSFPKLRGKKGVADGRYGNGNAQGRWKWIAGENRMKSTKAERPQGEGPEDGLQS